MKKLKTSGLLLAIILCNFLAAQVPKVITPQTPIIKGVNTSKLFSFAAGKKIIKIASNLKAIDIDRASINTASPKLQIWDACPDYKVNCEPQIWNITAIPNKANQYLIQSLGNEKYLTINPFNTTALILTNNLDRRNGSPYQSWTIESVGGNGFIIKATFLAANVSTTKALTATNNTNGSAVTIQDVCANASATSCQNQIWTFYNIVEQPHACLSVPLPPKTITPTCTNCEVGVSIEGLVASTSRMWSTGSTLRVRMDGGSALVRSKVVRYANEWTRFANIHFNFIGSGDAEIIVTFGNDGKSWSYVGRDCIDDGRRFGGNFTQLGTTHFGWFDDATPENEFSRVIVHEFGHALGFVHEQSHPDAGIPWDREAVYAFYGGPPNNWDRAQVDRDVFEISDRNQTQFTSYDRTSIMQYSISNELTIGDFEIGWNTNLSATDKAFARLMYPPGNIVGNKLVISVGTGGDDIRQNSNALIYLKLNSTALPEFRKSLNNNASWGGNSSNTVEIEMPAGTSITDILECKLLFTSGKQFETDTPDNWNLDKLLIDWITPDGFRTNLVRRTGRPFVRFFNTGETLLFRR